MNKLDNLLKGIREKRRSIWWVPKHTPDLEKQLEICKMLEDYQNNDIARSFKDYFGELRPSEDTQYRKFDISRYLGLITNERSYDDCEVTTAYKKITNRIGYDFNKVRENADLTDNLIEGLNLNNDIQPYLKPYQILVNYILNVEGNYITKEEFFLVVCTTWTEHEYVEGVAIISYARKNEVELKKLSEYGYTSDIRIHKYFEQHSNVSIDGNTISLVEVDLYKELESIIDDERQQLDIFKTNKYIEQKDIDKANNREPQKDNSRRGNKYKIDPKLSKTAIELVNYRCEYGMINSEQHKTFTNKRGVNYSEGHHLIPMSKQDFFGKKNLDRLENIVSLCPVCHKQVHYGDKSSRDEILSKLYLYRNSKLQSAGIYITLNDLLKSYS